jgi:hypothetical protein
MSTVIIQATLLMLAIGLASTSHAQVEKELSASRQRLIDTERILGAQESVASIPVYYNFDNKIGLARQGSTQYTKIIPYLPYRLNSEYSYVVIPEIQYQTFTNYDGYSGSGLNPIIIQSYFTQSNPEHRKNSLGIGPMLQIRTNMPAMFGSSQNAAGYTVNAVHRTEDWVLGITSYQSFGLGPAPTSSLSANNVFFRPFITHITKNFGNYTLDSEATINIDTGLRSFPINLMGSKLIDVGDVSLLFTLGVRYYTVNTMIGGAQGWGGRVGITYAFSH